MSRARQRRTSWRTGLTCTHPTTCEHCAGSRFTLVVMAAADDAVFAVREGIAVAAWAALVWVFFGKAGLSLALIYSAGYVGERMASAWGKSVKLPTLAGMLLGGLALRNIPGPWRDLLGVRPRLACTKHACACHMRYRARASCSCFCAQRGLRVTGWRPSALSPPP